MEYYIICIICFVSGILVGIGIAALTDAISVESIIGRKMW